MAKYLAVVVAILAFLCVAYRTSGNAVDDYEIPGYEECRSKLNEGAPRCFEDVYFKLTDPTSAECCRNYLKMESTNSDCFDLLFDDPTTWIDGLMSALRTCKKMLTAPYPYPAPTPAPAPAPYTYPAPTPAPAPAPSS